MSARQLWAWPRHHPRQALAAVLLVATAAAVNAQGNVSREPAAVDETSAFAEFMAGIRVDAAERGVRAATLDAVLPGIQLHRRAIEADRAQSEFVDTYERYLRRVSPRRIERGRELMQTQGEMIGRVAAGYRVQPRFIAAILGLESDYGTFPIAEPLFDVLATLAFDARRGTQFRTELLAALELVDKGYLAPTDLKSSWAGALGAPQFMPSNVLRLGVDHDGDGRIDLATVGPDVIASVANYLQRTGWQDNQTWGREVSLPPGGEDALPAPQNAGLTPDAACRRFQTLGAWRNLSDWSEAGVRLVDGSELPARNLPAALVIGDKGDERGYLVYRNFCSIMGYNPAFRYALAVGLLADAIAATPDTVERIEPAFP
jgi:membrane-bound lytic murein transglycosylase B